eukprot:g2239.t1
MEWGVIIKSPSKKNVKDFGMLRVVFEDVRDDENAFRLAYTYMCAAYAKVRLPILAPTAARESCTMKRVAAQDPTMKLPEWMDMAGDQPTTVLRVVRASEGDNTGVFEDCSMSHFRGTMHFRDAAVQVVSSSKLFNWIVGSTQYVDFFETLYQAVSTKIATTGRLLRFWDVGCGCGWISLLLAKLFPRRLRVIASDADPFARTLLEESIAANDVGQNMEVRIGDVMIDTFVEGTDEPADFIYFYPPQMNKTKPSNQCNFQSNSFALFVDGPSWTMLDKMLETVSSRLRPGGTLFLGVDFKNVAPVAEKIHRLALANLDDLFDVSTQIVSGAMPFFAASREEFTNADHMTMASLFLLDSYSGVLLAVSRGPRPWLGS